MVGAEIFPDCKSFLSEGQSVDVNTMVLGLIVVTMSLDGNDVI